MDVLMQYLIVCPLVFLAGFVDAIAGGGGLISLPAYMMAGLPAHTAIATNKLSASMGTTIATAKYAKNGYITLKNAIWAIICGMLGSSIGARLMMLIDETLFKKAMLVILPFIAIYVLKSRALNEDKVPFSRKKTTILVMCIAFCVGIYDGLYGPGTGTFLLLLLTGLAHVSIREAQGTTKVINLTTNLTALIVFLYHGQALLMLGLISGVFSILGNYIGASFFADKGLKIAKPIIIVVLTIFLVKLFLELVVF